MEFFEFDETFVSEESPDAVCIGKDVRKHPESIFKGGCKRPKLAIKAAKEPSTPTDTMLKREASPQIEKNKIDSRKSF